MPVISAWPPTGWFSFASGQHGALTGALPRAALTDATAIRTNQPPPGRRRPVSPRHNGHKGRTRSGYRRDLPRKARSKVSASRVGWNSAT